MTTFAITATASSTYSTYLPSRAFNRTNDTGWVCNTGGSGWLRAQLSTAQILTQYAITQQGTGASDSPAAWTFEGSNDASSWTVLDTRSAQTFTANVPAIYTFTNTTGYLYYRLNISATGGGSAPRVDELSLTPVLYVTSNNAHSSTPAVNAYDGSATTYMAADTVYASVALLIFQLVSARAFNWYSILRRDDAPTRNPRDWTFQGSNDNSSWTTLDTQAGITWPTAAETKTFTFSNSTAYAYYRLNPTADNGANALSIAEMEPGYVAAPTTFLILRRPLRGLIAR